MDAVFHSRVSPQIVRSQKTRVPASISGEVTRCEPVGPRLGRRLPRATPGPPCAFAKRPTFAKLFPYPLRLLRCRFPGKRGQSSHEERFPSLFDGGTEIPIFGQFAAFSGHGIGGKVLIREPLHMRHAGYPRAIL
jgi:hypothetical protein